MDKETLDRLFPYDSERGLVGKPQDTWEGKTKEQIGADIREMMKLFGFGFSGRGSMTDQTQRDVIARIIDPLAFTPSKEANPVAAADTNQYRQNRIPKALEKADRVLAELGNANPPSKEWEDRPTPYDAEILAAHPVNGGDHKRYELALSMVGDRHSKYALVDLVNWLLKRIEDGERWLPMSEARKDGAPVLLKVKDSIPGRDDLSRWNGIQLVGRHPGLADDGFDAGWNVAAPVGHGGFPDEWFEGWMPLPMPGVSHEKGIG